MKIKKFNEISNFPQYKRGEVIIWCNRVGENKPDDNFFTQITQKLGYKYIRSLYDGDAFLVEAPIGQEKQVGSDFVDNYPEFFTSYERRDIQMEYLFEQIDNIVSDIEGLRDSIGNLNEFGKTDLPKNWNNNIDSIIKSLDKIKY